MYPRILLITLLGSLITACAPYAGGGAYYQQTQVYTADPYPYGYSGFNYSQSYGRSYYVAPPRYYRPLPGPGYRPPGFRPGPGFGPPGPGFRPPGQGFRPPPGQGFRPPGPGYNPGFHNGDGGRPGGPGGGRGGPGGPGGYGGGHR